MKNRRVPPGGFDRRIREMLAATLLLVILSSIPAAMPATAQERGTDVSIALSKDAYWYDSKGTVRLDVTLDNKTGETLEDVAIRATVHSPNRSREDLDDCLAGEPTSSFWYAETFERDVSLRPGNNHYKIEMPLENRRLIDGVYPLSIEAMESGSVLADAVSELIVMSPLEPDDEPLKLSIVFNLLEPPHRSPTGQFEDEELSEECADGENPGWYRRLVSQAEKWPNLRLSFSLSPFLLEEMEAMSGGYTIITGDGEVSVGGDSAEAADVANMISSFRAMALDPRFQFIATPYASPNIEQLWDLKWFEDIREQIDLGYQVLGSGLGTTIPMDYFYPPGLLLDTEAIRGLGGEIGDLLLLNPQLLERSQEGIDLLKGTTLSQPVVIKGEIDDQTLALFADARLQTVIQRVGGSQDAHGVAQCILSDLTNLYQEDPESERVCVLNWPCSWRPSVEVFDEIMKAVAGAPWIETVTMAEGLDQVNPLENTVLELPDLEEEEETAALYFDRVSEARDGYLNYSKVVFSDNPLLGGLVDNLYLAESDVWRQWSKWSEGERYAEAVSGTINQEFAKVQMPVTTEVTLTGQKANIPLSVVNATGYRINANLILSSNGLYFPEGERQIVTLEPKENDFEIPVETAKGGNLRLSARLEAGDRVLSTVEMTVRTGRFSTFAIVFVSGLLGIIVAVWAIRKFAGRKAGEDQEGETREAEGS